MCRRNKLEVYRLAPPKPAMALFLPLTPAIRRLDESYSLIVYLMVQLPSYSYTSKE